MSEEDETIEEPQTIEEQLAPENVKPTTLNKNGKPRKQLSPEHLERLAKARARGNAIRKQNIVKKLEDKIENINKATEPILGVKPKKESKPEVINEEEEEEEVKETKKKSTKKKTKIIVEQSSDDSDEFEQNDNVVFVKRVSRKKKEPMEPSEPSEPPLQRQQAYEQPPQQPPKPPMKPQLTPEQMMLRDNYNSMFSGNFINQQGMRKHY